MKVAAVELENVPLLTVAAVQEALWDGQRRGRVDALIANLLAGSVCSPTCFSAFRELILPFTWLVPLLILTLATLLSLPASSMYRGA